MKKTPVVTASEIGRFLYCNRSWWYEKEGFERTNQKQLQYGEAYHAGIGKKIRKFHRVRFVLISLLIISLLMIVFALRYGPNFQ